MVVHYSILYSKVYDSVGQCSIAQYSAAQLSSAHYPSSNCITILYVIARCCHVLCVSTRRAGLCAAALSCIASYTSAQYWIVPYCTVWCAAAVQCAVLYYTVFHGAALSCSTALYSTVLCCSAASVHHCNSQRCLVVCCILM